MQHSGARIKVDLREARVGGERGFITLIAMPAAHNETHYRADVVRLGWLERHEQPRRSEERTRKQGGQGREENKGGTLSDWEQREWVVIDGRGSLEKSWDKAKKDGMREMREGKGGKYLFDSCQRTPSWMGREEKGWWRRADDGTEERRGKGKEKRTWGQNNRQRKYLHSCQRTRMA